MERLQMQLAIGCLRMLSTLGHQGPAEGSVLGEESEDDARRVDHQLAASRQSGYRGGAHSPEKLRPAKEKVAPGSPSRSAMRPESPVHAYNAMPTAASDLDDAWIDTLLYFSLLFATRLLHSIRPALRTTRIPRPRDSSSLRTCEYLIRSDLTL